MKPEKNKKTQSVIFYSALTGGFFASLYSFLQFHDVRFLPKYNIPETGHGGFIGHHNQFSEYLVLAFFAGYLLQKKTAR